MVVVVIVVFPRDGVGVSILFPNWFDRRTNVYGGCKKASRKMMPITNFMAGEEEEEAWLSQLYHKAG